ncbi:MAG: hypothetical protein QOG83_1361 [Alphaproteobacteria bacterium]|jgi:hypothetical protein|nr:hypothetical protein [Alphaproteobacteria bacterium]
MNSSFPRAAAAALSAVILASAAAAAQDRPSAPSPQPRAAPPDCSAEIVPGDSSNPQTRGQGGSNLSDTLSRSDGVICPPPSADRDIATPPPGGGNTPVIPPPGSPGGDPTVRPK